MATLQANENEKEVFTVSQLNRAARGLLETNFPNCWVEGEISNFVRASSGHWYFSLKDSQAQIRSAMFANRNRYLKFSPEDGMQIVVKGKISIYENRGDYQLIVEDMEQAGFGALQRAFELLKQKLAQEGFFAEERKRAIPRFAKQIGVITSPTGAAIRDIITTLSRRFPSIPVVIYPTSVQGNEAATQIVKAIKTANRRNECDVLILARGGGSIEDLWSFNDENVARAIYNSALPIVSGVGHEIDFTIADFVADVRAATPTAAAELVSPHQEDYFKQLARFTNQLSNLIFDWLEKWLQKLLWLEKRLQHPGDKISQQMQQLDYLERALIKNMQHYCSQQFLSLTELRQQIHHNTPMHLIARLENMRCILRQRLRNASNTHLEKNKHKLAQLTTALETMSPLATLSRGYAIIRNPATNAILRDSKQLAVGEKITATLHHGELECTVDKVV